MWKPRYHHVTQIHNDGSGWNDCAEASLARALMEYDPYTVTRAGVAAWGIVRNVANPNNPATIWDLVSQLGVYGRGEGDTPGQGFTSSDGIWRILDAFGLATATTYVDQEDGSSRAYNAAYNAPLSLCWVDGTVERPASFPANYFGGDWGYDHLTLWLPNNGGVDNLFNDPLTVWPDTHTDVRYELGSIREAMGGAWLLPTPEGVSSNQVWLTRRKLDAKLLPNHVCKPVETLEPGTKLTRLAGTTPHWGQFGLPGGKIGWVEFINVYAT